jgi:S1-C subfamily serine protease
MKTRPFDPGHVSTPVADEWLTPTTGWSASGAARPPLPPNPPKAHGWARAGFVGGIVAAVVAGGVAFGTVKLADTDPKASPTTAAALNTPAGSGNVAAPLNVRSVVATVGPSVVAIEIGYQAGGGQVQPVAAGSGVVISADGLVMTNAHVVLLTDPSGQPLTNPVITAKMSDGKARTAAVLGVAANNDFALLRLQDTAGLVPARLGDSDAAQVGDDVVAIGNALDLGVQPTVTRGIISAKNRTLSVDANLTLSDLLQTDAAINHGNSGGALANAAGEVIGINSAGIPDAQNVGFAIAINKVKPLIDQLKAGHNPGAAAVSFLGVTTQQTAQGVAITGVTRGSAADAAGLRPGDVITAIDGHTVTSPADVASVMKAHKPGDSIDITVDRNGNPVNVTARLGSRTP